MNEKEKKFKVVRASNFDKEWFNEEFVDSAPLSKKEANNLCEDLNLTYNRLDSEYFWKVVPEDYQLYIGIVP